MRQKKKRMERKKANKSFIFQAKYKIDGMTKLSNHKERQNKVAHRKKELR